VERDEEGCEFAVLLWFSFAKVVLYLDLGGDISQFSLAMKDSLGCTG
jgi:hypothetical protein